MALVTGLITYFCLLTCFDVGIGSFVDNASGGVGIEFWLHLLLWWKSVVAPPGYVLIISLIRLLFFFERV